MIAEIAGDTFNCEPPVDSTDRAHSMKASAQVTAPGATISMVVAVSTRPNRQNPTDRTQQTEPNRQNPTDRTQQTEANRQKPTDRSQQTEANRQNKSTCSRMSVPLVQNQML